MSRDGSRSRLNSEDSTSSVPAEGENHPSVIQELDRLGVIVTNGLAALTSIISQMKSEMKDMKADIKLELNTMRHDLLVAAKSNKPDLCKFCSKHPLSSECRTFKTASARIHQATMLNLCLSCLQNSHTPTPCRNPHGCSKCRSKLHIHLCPCSNLEQPEEEVPKKRRR